MNVLHSIRSRHHGISAGKKRGFTLVEMALAIGLSLGVSSAVVGVLTQHSSFMAILGQFAFLRDDAPQINIMMNSLTSQAVSYRLYGGKGDAFNGTNAVNSGASAVRLMFRNPNGSFEQAVVAFETVAGEGQLNFYQNNGGWGEQPDWTISSKPDAVVFDDTSGIFEMTLTGPNLEQITYAGTTE